MSFKRYPRHRKSRLGDAWRRPRGWQNKLRLEKKGLISRRAEPQDRRSFRVVATPAGMDIVNALEPGGRDFFLSQVGPLADPQLQQFADALALVLEVLRHDGEAPAELVAANAVAS